MSERLSNRSAKSSRFSKRMVAKREFKFTSPTKKTSPNKRKAQNVDPKAENSAQKSNENVFDLPPPIWASSPRDTPYGKSKSKVQKKYLEISCIEPVSVRTAKNLKRIEESHFAPIATPKQNITKSSAKIKRPLLTKWKQNKTTSIASIHHLQNSGKEVIKNKNRSKNRIAKSYQETNISHHSNKSLHKENKSKQLSKKEKLKVSDQTLTASKSQQAKIQSTSSRNTRRSPSVLSEQTSVRDTVSEKGSVKRKLQKSRSSEDYLSNPPKSSKLQTNREQSVEAAYSQSSSNYSRSTNKTKSSKANSKRQKSNITPSRNNSGAKPKQQSGSRLGQRSHSLPKDDSSSPNVTRTKQSPSKKKISSRDSEHSTDQKKVNVSKGQNVSVSHVSRESASKSSKKNLSRKSSLTVFNLSSDEEVEKIVKKKNISNIQGKKPKRRSTESSASGKKKSNSKNKISSSSPKKSNQSKDHSSSKLNPGKYANILSYLSTQNKQQTSNRTDKTFESIAAGTSHGLHEQKDKKDAEKQFSYSISELSSLHISHITSSSENEDDSKLNEVNKCLEYIMFPGESDNNISLNNPKPIKLNVLKNNNSTKRTAKSLSELDVILDVVDHSIEMVLGQITDVDKKLVVSRMRNFVKEKISTDIKRQLQFIQLQNILYQKSLQIQRQQEKYFQLKVANNRLNSELNEATKTQVEDPAEMFTEFCKKFSEFKKSSNQME
ncbi:claspin-like isoform X1 [Octopus sinensis]|uniref:Claspin-like isoform X1 n=1 Tax=Octopus sinensis TaxID=2607531 RepID=A0A6P7SJ14_9MOLL|nr:claspin-like isoform X1 [Octopus sinensis]XP_036359759.1 claspin-like isoform X1 [Octopus sinensis]